MELVVDDSGAAGKVAADSSIAPGSPRRAGNAFLVELSGDNARALSRGIVAKDAAYDFGFIFIYAANSGLSGEEGRIHNRDRHQIGLAGRDPGDHAASSGQGLSETERSSFPLGRREAR